MGTNHDNVSGLSPFITRRLILEQEIIEQILNKHPFTKVEKFVQEVMWRSYWKGWLEMRPKVWDDYLREVELAKKQLNDQQITRAEEILGGCSGVSFMDHFTNELKETGYLHNHARMWWASYWIHIEKLPWQLGAAFFFSHLLDADAASNTLSWRWVAGLQTKGKAYLINRGNLLKYCSPEILINPAELDHLNEVSPIDISESKLYDPEHSNLIKYKLPSVESDKRIGVWVHNDDLCPEFGPLTNFKPVSVAGFKDAAMSAKYGQSNLAQRFTEDSMKDALNRCGGHFKCNTEYYESGTIKENITKWITKNSIDHVVAFKPFIGPVGKQLRIVEGEFLAHNVSLSMTRRNWDQNLFCHAKSGFFLSGRIPKNTSVVTTKPRNSAELSLLMKKINLPQKICVVCGRSFSWRKKWERNWLNVKYCSKKCQKYRNNNG